MTEALRDHEVWGLCYSNHGIVLRRVHWCTSSCPRTFHGVSHRIPMAPDWALADGGYTAPIGWVEFALTGEP
jgi:hypothetical protein